MEYLKKSVFILIACLPLIISNCEGTKLIGKDKGPGSSGREAVDFVKSSTLTEVLEEAQSKGKIVFLDMYTTWCAPCKVMDQEVYTDPSVREYLTDNMVSYKVDAEKGNGPDLSIIYNVQVYPTLLFLDDRGRELVRKDGALGITDFLNLAEQAKAMQ